MLVEAYRDLNPKVDNSHLVVVGDGPFMQEMQAATTGLPCTFTGVLSGEELVAAYASSDVFVFPSTTDTFGNVILEAQACGLPVIVSDQGGPCENMVPDQTGLVIPGDDRAKLTAAMHTLATNSTLRQSMGAAARRYMEERSFDAAFLKMWDLYRDVPTGSDNDRAQAVGF